MRTHPFLFCTAVLTLAAAARAGEISVPGDHATIQAAVDAAASGDVVVVGPGIYAEQVVSAKAGITIVGHKAVMDGGDGSCLSLTGDGNAVVGMRFEGGTDQVVLAGNDCIVRNCISAAAGESFVSIQGSGSLVLRCRVLGCGDDAIQVEGDASTVAKVRVRGCGRTGIVVTGDGCTVAKCGVEGAAEGGISLEGNGDEAAKNRVTACGAFGLDLQGDGGTLTGNLALGCGSAGGAGFEVAGAGNTLTGNLALRCEDDGFSISGDANTLSKDKAMDCADDGIDIEGGAGVSLHGCLVMGNGGTGVENGGEGTDASRCVILHNATDVSLDAGLTSSFGQFKGNIWSSGSLTEDLGL